jgi:hypothetical protein
MPGNIQLLTVLFTLFVGDAVIAQSSKMPARMGSIYK